MGAGVLVHIIMAARIMLRGLGTVGMRVVDMADIRVMLMEAMTLTEARIRTVEQGTMIQRESPLTLFIFPLVHR